MPLRAVLFAEEGLEAAAKLDETAYTQPALFASRGGAIPSVGAVGASSLAFCWAIDRGIAAAHVSGVWSLKDGARVVARVAADASADCGVERWWRSRRAS